MKALLRVLYYNRPRVPFEPLSWSGQIKAWSCPARQKLIDTLLFPRVLLWVICVG